MDPRRRRRAGERGIRRRGAAAFAAGLCVAAGLCLAACDRGPPAATPAAGAASAAFPTFVDAAASSGIDFVHDNGFDGQRYRIVETVNGGVALLDVDGDGWLDVYFTNASRIEPGSRPPRNALYRNRGDGTFEDISARSGADAAAHSLGCAAADVDGDGDPDLLVTTLGPNLLLINQGGGRFADRAAEAGIAGGGMQSGCVFFDMDADGDLDLYVASYVIDEKKEQSPALVRGIPSYWPPLNYRPAPHHLYENLGGASFRDVSEASGIRAGGPGRGLGVIAGDFNNDGHADLYVANDMSANYMLLGDGKGRFREEGYFNGTALSDDGMPLGSMGLAVSDYDGDGFADVFVTNYQGQPNNLYRGSSSGQFQDVVQLVGAPSHSLPEVSWGVGFADFNHDGRDDLFVANGHLNPETRRLDPTTSYAQAKRVFRNRGDGGFEDVSARCGEAVLKPRVSRGAAFGDIDNDGDVDVVINDSIGPPELLKNQGEGNGSWVLVRLAGAGENRDAIGARVTISAGGRRQWRERRSASSYLSADDPRIHFGLGSAERLERLEVRWPDGTVEAHEGLPARRLLEIRQGEKDWKAVALSAAAVNAGRQ